jgi:hypothetical protein
LPEGPDCVALAVYPVDLNPDRRLLYAALRACGTPRRLIYFLRPTKTVQGRR